jgi:hypothetical protein
MGTAEKTPNTKLHAYTCESGCVWETADKDHHCGIAETFADSLCPSCKREIVSIVCPPGCPGVWVGRKRA